MTADDIRSYQLTEDDIALYIKSFRQIDRVMAELQKGIDGEQMTTDPYSVFASLQLTNEQKKIIKEAGFSSTAEFLRVVGAITAAYAACSMEKAIGEMRAAMQKELGGMTPEMKANMEKDLAEMEAKAKPEYFVSDHNMEMVRKHYDDLTRAFLSVMGAP